MARRGAVGWLRAFFVRRRLGMIVGVFAIFSRTDCAAVGSIFWFSSAQRPSSRSSCCCFSFLSSLLAPALGGRCDVFGLDGRGCDGSRCIWYFGIPCLLDWLRRAAGVSVAGCAYLVRHHWGWGLCCSSLLCFALRCFALLCSGYLCYSLLCFALLCSARPWVLVFCPALSCTNSPSRPPRFWGRLFLSAAVRRWRWRGT